MEAEEIEDEATECGEIGAGIFLPGPHLIILEGDIETPMDLILHAPMGTNRIGQEASVGSNTADIEPPFDTGLAIDRALRLDHTEALQVRPLLRLSQTVQLCEGPAASDFEAAMILLDRLDETVRRVLPSGGLTDFEEINDRVGQLG